MSATPRSAIQFAKRKQLRRLSGPSRDAREVRNDRLRSALMLATRCLEELGPLNNDLSEEVRRFVARWRALRGATHE